MNPRLQFLFSRRSVRSYTSEAIPDVLVQDLLEAAMAAPSACAKDPWEFVVIRERETLCAVASVLPNGKMLIEAPLAIVVCGDISKAHGGELSYMLQDCAAAIENTLIAAHTLGLGACWLGVHPRPERIAAFKELFSLPESVIPISVIALGMPAERPQPRTRFNSAAVHLEKW